MSFAILCKTWYTITDILVNIDNKTILLLQGGFCMKRKFQIPKMSNEDIAKWYTSIKPIVNHKGRPTYLRELSDRELVNFPYTWLNQPTIMPKL